MILKKIDDVIEALERIRCELGGDPAGETVFEGETVKLVESTKSLPGPKKKPGPRGGQTKIKAAEDPTVWPTIPGGVSGRGRMALRVQHLLREALDSEPGIDRRDIELKVVRRLPPSFKTMAGKKGNKKWKICLSNMLRNYVQAGYIREEIKNGQRAYWVGS